MQSGTRCCLGVQQFLAWVEPTPTVSLKVCSGTENYTDRALPCKHGPAVYLLFTSRSPKKDPNCVRSANLGAC